MCTRRSGPNLSQWWLISRWSGQHGQDRKYKTSDYTFSSRRSEPNSSPLSRLKTEIAETDEYDFTPQQTHHKYVLQLFSCLTRDKSNIFWLGTFQGWVSKCGVLYILLVLDIWELQSDLYVLLCMRFSNLNRGMIQYMKEKYEIVLETTLDNLDSLLNAF